MADNYGTVTAADAYHTARGNIAWMGFQDSEKLSALLRASEWIDGNYMTLFAGYKTAGRAQVREWPRTAAYDIYAYQIGVNEIPREVENATYEAALREALNPGALSVDFTAADVIKKAAVEGAVSVEFGGSGSASDAQLVVPIVDAILAPVLVGGSLGLATGGLSGSRYRG